MGIGKSRKIYQKWRFRVEIDGIGDAFFGKVGPLEFSSEVVKYNDGGALIPHKQLGMLEFPALTLERGMTDDDQVYEWALEGSNAAADAGASLDEYKRNMSVFQLDRKGDVVKTFRVFNGIPSKFTAGDWDNSANEVNVESLEVEYDYFEIDSTAT